MTHGAWIADSAAGLTLPKRYQIVRVLGAGGMGVVYEAIDHERRMNVALKTLHRADVESLYRIKQEFRQLADLYHPNLVVLHDLVADRGGSFFTMELVRGRSFVEHASALDDFISTDAPTLPATPTPRSPPQLSGVSPLALSYQAARIGIADDALPASTRTWRAHVDRLRAATGQLTRAVGFLHDAGLLHRDLKPSNVLVTSEGRVTVLDFGLAADRAAPREQSDDRLVGTPAYMAPEQALGEPLSPAADWYAVGLMLFEALTGRYPFTGSTLDVLLARTHTEAPPPRSIVADLPEDLSSLTVDLLRRNPRERPSGAEVLRRLGEAPARSDTRTSTRPPAAKGSTALIGRATELAALRSALAECRRGSCVVVTVRGASGMGKTTLLDAFLNEASASGARVFRGRALEREAVPFKALDRVVDAIAVALDAADARTASAIAPLDAVALARLFPVLGRVSQLHAHEMAASATPDPIELRRMGFAAMKDLFTKLAEQRPLVVAIDDAQWGDADSATLIASLLAPVAPSGLLLVVGFREEEVEASAFVRELHATLAARRSGAGWREIDVGPLALDDATSLAMALVGPEHAQRIASESRGNPFFLHELALFVANAGDVASMRDVSLDAVLRLRVRGTDARAQRLLDIVAIAGGPVEQGAALEASGLGDAGPSALAQLRGASLVRLRGAGRDDEIETYHDRIREVVRAAVAPDEAREHHLRLARALEAGGRADPERLYTHYAGAGDVARASEAAAIAADRAARALAFVHAIDLYRVAITLDPRDATRRATLLVGLGDVLASSGRGADAAEAYLDAADTLEPARARDARRRAGLQLLLAGHVDAGRETIDAALHDIGMSLPSTPARAIASYFWGQLRLRMRRARARERPSVDPSAIERADTCKAVAEGLMPVDPIRGADYLTRWVHAELDVGDGNRVAHALYQASSNAALLGKSGERRAAELATFAETASAARPDARVPVLATLARACAAHAQGRWREAFDGFEEATRLSHARGAGATVELSTARLFAGWDLYFLGRLREAERRARGHLHDATLRGDLYTCTVVRMMIAVADLSADDPEGARVTVERAMSAWPQSDFNLQHHSALITHVQIDLYVGDARGAERRLRDAAKVLDRSLLLRIQLLRALTNMTRGNVAVARAADSSSTHEERRVALHAAERAANALAREEMPYADGFAALTRAGVHAQRGDADRANAELARAVDAFDKVDMSAFAALARRALGKRTNDADDVARAEASLRAEGVIDVARWSSMFAPAL